MMIPKRKMEDFISKLNEAESDGPWTSEKAARFRGYALAIREADIGEGDLALGMLAAMDGDLPEIRKRFRNAIAYRGHSLETDYNHGRALFMAGDYGGAIEALLPYAEEDREAARLLGTCCQELGLEGKAEHYFALADPDRSSERFAVRPEERKKFIAPAMAKLEKSMDEDRKIWESLSSR